MQRKRNKALTGLKRARLFEEMQDYLWAILKDLHAGRLPKARFAPRRTH